MITPSQQTAKNTITHSRKFVRQLQELKNKVFVQRPALQKLVERYGELSLYEFTKIQVLSRNNSYLTTDRKNELISFIKEDVAAKLGPIIAEEVAQQLKNNYFISTTDHHGPLTYPGFVNSNLLSHLLYEKSKNKNYKNIILLACSNISFDNFSFPRGLTFSSIIQTDEISSNNQLVFFPRSARPCPVFAYPSFNENSIREAKKRIEAWVREGIVTSEIAEQLHQIVDSIYASPEILNTKHFSDQVTISNYHLWNKILSKFTNTPSNLIYLNQEELVNKLLMKFHLKQKTTIYNIMFKEDYLKAFTKHFDNIHAGFSLEKKLGTFLFWALPPGQKYRVQLWRKDNYLVSNDETYSVELTPEAIFNAIERNELIPSTLLSFIILSFYYGIELIGGMNQTSYLKEMKYAYIAMKKELGDLEGMKRVEYISTSRQAFSRAVASMMETPSGDLTPTTLIDLFLYGNPNALQEIEQTAKNVRVEEAILRILPIMYRSIYNTEITPDDPLLLIDEPTIEEHIGMKEKIIPAGFIK